MPSVAELSGSWVAIGFFGAAYNHGREIASVECAGLRRGKTLEQVMLIKGNFVEARFIGVEMQVRTLTPDGRGSLEFPIDFGGDANPRYRCRLTATGTLACLVDVYDEGVEIKPLVGASPVQRRRPTQHAGQAAGGSYQALRFGTSPRGPGRLYTLRGTSPRAA